MGVYEDMANDAGEKYGTEGNRRMAEIIAADHEREMRQDGGPDEAVVWREMEAALTKSKARIAELEARIAAIAKVRTDWLKDCDCDGEGTCGACDYADRMFDELTLTTDREVVAVEKGLRCLSCGGEDMGKQDKAHLCAHCGGEFGPVRVTITTDKGGK